MSPVTELPSATRPPAPLLERDADLAALRALVDAARDGNGRLAMIEGSAGIGKTRLLAETRATGERLGLRVLYARGGELEREFAFGIVRQLFEPLLAIAADQREELLAGAAGLAAPLFDREELTEAGAGDLSFAVLHGLYWLAANIALAQPTLLVVDDLHWADQPSLRWLSYLARRLEGLPLMVAAGTRPPKQGPDAAVLLELVADPATVVVKPGLLGLESVAILGRDAFGTDPDPEFCAECHLATGGNPLYLRALLATLAGEGVAPTAASAGRVREVGPEPVARVVSLRLARVAPEATALAQAIAVLGQGAEVGLAGALAGLEGRAADDALAALGGTELLRMEPALDFVHPVVRAAIYETMSTLDRSSAHRRAAGLLADRGADPDQIASHLLFVAPAGDPFVVSVMRSAAARVLGRGGTEEAAAYLRRALAEPPTGSDRAATLTEVGVVERGVDLPAAIEHLREAVGLIEERGQLASAALECGRALGYCNMNAEAIEVLRTAIDRAGEEHPDLREQATADLINASWTDAEFLPTAKELLAGVRDEQLVGGPGSDMLHATLAHIEVRNGVDRARAGALARQALASGSLENHSSQHMYLALDSLRAAGEHEVALAAYARALAAARDRGDLLNIAGLLGFRGWLLLDRGDLRAAEADVREGLEFSRVAGGITHIIYSTVFVVDFLLERGDIDEAETTLGELGLEDQLPVNFHFLVLLNARGRLRLARRRLADALADFEAMREIDEALDMSATPMWPWRPNVATALHALGREDEARELAAEELEVAERWGESRRTGIALRTLGLVLGGPAGERRLREAVEVLASSPARLEHARALIELGSALRRRNERSKARLILREGVELAHRCSAPNVAERGNEELAATGARPRTQLLTGLDSLTASERRVAQLAAEELSNKEIAQQLFVTVKTVEVHLSHVYRKLDIGSRRQLGGALAGSHAEAIAVG